MSHAPLAYSAPIAHSGPIIQAPPLANLELDRRLVQLLCAIQEGESDIEACRQRLCSIPDFSLNAAF